MYGIFTNICPKNHPNVGKYIPYMEHMGLNLRERMAWQGPMISGDLNWMASHWPYLPLIKHGWKIPYL